MHSMRQWRSARRAAETKVLTVNALEVTGEMQSCTPLLKKRCLAGRLTMHELRSEVCLISAEMKGIKYY